MYNHRKTTSRAPGMSARQYVTTGVTGAAMFGIGVLLAAPPGAPAPTIAEVKLASTESMFPLSPLDECLLTTEGCGPGGATPTALALDVGTLQTFSLIGPGGFLFGDGLDAVEGCEGTACNGGNGGLFGGNGGNGLNGGTGGNAGFFFGNGGNGGDGVAADGELEATPGGNGGNGSFFFGNGGDGGDGADAVYDEVTGELISPATDGGDGGNAGNGALFFGNGGNGGERRRGRPTRWMPWIQ